MELDVTRQGVAMAQSLLLGAGAGVVYDLFRVLRVRIKLRGLGALLDLLFWLGLTVTLFLWSLDAWGGWVRLYGAAGMLVGGAVYFRFFSLWVLRLAYCGADVVEFLVHLVLLPMKGLFFLLKKIEFFAKNSFSYGCKWYKIRQLNWKRRHSAARGNGGGCHADEASGSADQDRSAGSADLHGNGAAGPAG
jgi:hypothetical protein